MSSATAGGPADAMPALGVGVKWSGAQGLVARPQGGGTEGERGLGPADCH